VSLAAQNQLLAIRVQHSLERIVSTREEERRRLRRDIHDGLGPTLTATRLHLEVARDLIPADPWRAAELLDELILIQQQVIDDVRRLVEGLRPPVLDQHGLVTALRLRAARLTRTPEGEPTCQVTVDADPDIEPLPAAVEVAAFRIVMEALTNVLRHAQARSCRIELRRDTELKLNVTDDGRGVPQPYRAGVGLTSMRERAAEVGGTCHIVSPPGGGTQVSARIPLVSPPDSI
jgi:signal transduction histidine kinase